MGPQIKLKCISENYSIQQVLQIYFTSLLSSAALFFKVLKHYRLAFSNPKQRSTGVIKLFFRSLLIKVLK